MTRRETLDWLRADLDRLRGVTDLVCAGFASTDCFDTDASPALLSRSDRRPGFLPPQAKLKENLSAFARNHKQFVPSLGLSTAGMEGGPIAKLIGRKGPNKDDVLARRFFA